MELQVIANQRSHYGLRSALIGITQPADMEGLPGCGASAGAKFGRRIDRGMTKTIGLLRLITQLRWSTVGVRAPRPA